jgi:Protein of unknown function (DUF3110)
MNRLAQLMFVLFASVNGFTPSFGVRRNRQASHRSVVGNDKFDMDELRQRIINESNPYQHLFKTKEWEKRPKPEKVNIIFFQPDTAEEGIHTVEYPKGSASNIILAFESMKDCGTFAANLRSQGFFDPSVSIELLRRRQCRSNKLTSRSHFPSYRQPQEVDLRSLELYCEQLGVFVQVVPRGMDIRPPTQNVEEFGYNPLLKEQKSQLDYLFEMSDSELEEIGALETIELVGAWD